MASADPRSEWSEPSRVAEYLSRELPFRDAAEELLVAALPQTVRRVLDLGTGDGRLLALVDDARPGAELVGLDVSEPMRRRAATRLADRAERVLLVNHDLAESLPGKPRSFDVIVSGLAVHHTDHQRRQQLYEEARHLLRPGGLFAQLDLVQSPTPEMHAVFRRAIGREHDDPSDQLARLEDELTWLRQAGFALVDCRFKWQELALLVATA